MTWEALSIETVATAAAEHFDTPSPVGKPLDTDGRLTLAAARSYTDASLRQIANHFGVVHSTVARACAYVDQAKRSDYDILAAFFALDHHIALAHPLPVEDLNDDGTDPAWPAAGAHA